MGKEVIIRKAKEDFKQLHRLMMQVHKVHLKERSDI